MFKLHQKDTRPRFYCRFSVLSNRLLKRIFNIIGTLLGGKDSLTVTIHMELFGEQLVAGCNQALCKRRREGRWKIVELDWFSGDDFYCLEPINLLITGSSVLRHLRWILVLSNWTINSLLKFVAVSQANLLSKDLIDRYSKLFWVALATVITRYKDQ